MTEINAKKETEIKSGIIPRDIFKSDIIFLFKKY